MENIGERLQGYYYEDLEIGMNGIYAKMITEADIVLFADVTGDTNPVHLNREYAESTIFKERIAHGMLSAGFISTVFGTKMPGPGCIYLSQNLRFKAPVKIGDTVTAECTITSLVDKKKFIEVDTRCYVDGKTVIEGEAVIMVPSRG